MEPLKVGQVWKEYGNEGNRARWEVTHSQEEFAMVRNMDTLQQKTVLPGAVSTFTFQCELTNERGWN